MSDCLFCEVASKCERRIEDVLDAALDGGINGKSVDLRGVLANLIRTS
jgi:hypothetical protein